MLLPQADMLFFANCHSLLLAFVCVLGPLFSGSGKKQQRVDELRFLGQERRNKKKD